MHEKINGQSQNKWVSEVNWLWLWKWSQSMIKIDLKEVLWKWSLEKSQGLGSRFLVRKHEDVCTTLMSNLKGKVWKSLGHNEWWMDEDG